MRTLLLIPLLFATSNVIAEPHHKEHDAHQHGHAELKLAWSKDELIIELDTPAMNIIGFEHAAENGDDKKALKHAVEFFQKPNQLITPNIEAECHLTSVDIESSLLEHQADMDHENEHKDEHEHENSEPSHADFEIAIAYQCKQAKLLRYVDTSGLFSTFKGIEELDTEWLSDHKQGAKELTPLNTKINLK